MNDYTILADGGIAWVPDLLELPTFGDRAKGEARAELEKIRADLQAAPTGPNPRRWAKYYREKLAKQEEHIKYLDWLFANFNNGQWSAEDDQQLQQLAQLIRTDERRRSDNLKRIENNEGNIRQWKLGGLEHSISGYGEQVIARLTRENLGRREAIRRAETKQEEEAA